MDRVKTGIEGLDQLLYGGFLRGDAVVVAGAPGTGKTSLGMQYLYHGATDYKEPGLFITFEEFPERIYRDAENFGWDFRGLEDQGKLKVLFTSPEVLQQDIIRDQGIVQEMIAEIGATRVVVDSISNLENFVDDSRQFREAVYGLVNALKAQSLTALLTRELREGEETGTGPEEFVADGLIYLTRAYVGNQRMRFLEVTKSRGTPHVAMPGLYFLGQGGIHLVPPFQTPFYRFEEAVSTGIHRLDDLLGGGIPYGSFYLMEIDGNLHQAIFEAGFTNEALETGDRYIRLAGPSDGTSRWRALVNAAGSENSLQQGIASGNIVFLGTGRGERGTDVAPAEWITEEVERLCPAEERSRMRFDVDISRLFAFLPQDEASAVVASVASHCRASRSVVLGTVNPHSLPLKEFEKLRASADGIVRVWSEGSYSYLQVIKTVNSARTPIYAIREVSQPPFIEILSQ
jgi:circadian clock protein KaiC